MPYISAMVSGAGGAELGGALDEEEAQAVVPDQVLHLQANLHVRPARLKG